ncbi:MAG: energy-coupling factor ABC transporter ATP-binding protein [Bacillota bacterium]
MLEVKNLSISYNEGRLIKNLNFDLQKNRILGLSGKNGSGKTSVCLAVAGLLDEAFVEGSINIGAENIKEMSVASRCENIGIVFQQPEEQIFSPTVEDEIVFGVENLCLSRNTISQRLKKVTNLLDISHLQNKMTNCLCAGEKQLVAIASVLIMRPKILVADEITSALDKDKKALVRKVLTDYAKDERAVLMTAHSKDDLKICHDIIELGGV